MKKAVFIILTAASLVFAGCASNEGTVSQEELPVTLLPASVGEDPLKGQSFTGVQFLYKFNDNNTLTIYENIALDNTDKPDWVEVGTDLYSYDTTKKEFYTKVVSIIDPVQNRVYSSASEFESYILQYTLGQVDDLFATDDSASKKSKKFVAEYTKKQCHKLAEETFSHVVTTKYTFHPEEKTFVIDYIPSLYLSKGQTFHSNTDEGKYSVLLNSLQFQVMDMKYYETENEKVYYVGVPEEDNGARFKVDLYRYDFSGEKVTVTKAGTLKAEYVTNWEVINDEETSITTVEKKLHFTKLPSELKDLADTTVFYNARRQIAVFTY